MMSAEPQYQQLRLLQGDSPVSLSVTPGSDEARMMTVTSGRRCAAWLQNSDPVGSLLRTFLEYDGYTSTLCLLTWKLWTTPSGRLIFRLAHSVPRTSDTGCGLWPTPTKRFDSGVRKDQNAQALEITVRERMWPTPSATDTRARRPPENYVITKNNTLRAINKDGGQTAVRLSQAVKFWPTPRANERAQYNSQDGGMALSRAVRFWATPRSNGGTGPGEHGQGGQNLQTQTGGLLNPRWVEWLMGYPAGWTDLER
jgi:hypothetical protein